MNKLIVDIGNTRIKTAIFSDNNLVKLDNWSSFDELSAVAERKNFKKVIISTVSGVDPMSLKTLFTDIDPLFLSHQTPLPIKLHYKSVQTLGVDRIAGAVGAYQMYPNANNLIIDIGTCITYDFMNAENQYLGGGISPGVGIRFKALHEFTGKLPLVEWDNEGFPALIGDSTQNSILSGVLQGTWMEIKGIIAAYNENYQKINTIITGGDSFRFESLINHSIFVAPKLVLQGLNCILDYND